MYINFFKINLIAILIIATSFSVQAGTTTLTNSTVITEQVAPGGKISISVKFKNGGSGTLKIKDGSPGDKDPRPGHIKYTLPTGSEEASKVTIKVIDKPIAPAKGAINSIDLGGSSIASLLPIDFYDIFSDELDIILLSVIDAPLFSLEESPFFEDQSIDILNGNVAGISGISFFDATILFGGLGTFIDNDIDINSATIAGLPSYTGSATVASLVEFRNVPEPNTVFLILLGVLLFGMINRKNRGL